MTLPQRLDSFSGFHWLVRSLGLRPLVGLALGLCPLERTLPGSGVRYRCRSLESFYLSDEIFRRGVYGRALDPDGTRTFCDLGSNAGLFAALLAHRTGRRDLRGLMVDANPAMVEETRWHLEANELHGVVALHGLAGASAEDTTGAFYLLPSSLGSSRFPVHEPGKLPKGAWRRIVVPRIRLERAWREHLGEERCRLLKVDIEGSEEELFRSEGDFLRRVDRIVVEWHKWLVAREGMEAALRAQGFSLDAVLEERETTGVALYRRSA
ncbi:MAG: FkbM family methyltransferase [Planctomycetes bacterium]|nr:FkbM family methyltransferase [Planctomycetota bacterium]